MSEFVFKLPDLGEGTVEAEIVEWHVKPGDSVQEGDVIVDVMTDKANVEVPAPVTGTILRTTGEPGDMVAVGAELVAVETASGQGARPAPSPPARTEASEPEAPEPVAAEPEAPEPPAPEAAMPEPGPPSTPEDAAPQTPAAGSETSISDSHAEVASESGEASPRGEHAPTSPAIRRRAKEAGVDLADVPGSGPGGRILRRDLDAFLQNRATGQAVEARPAQPAAGAVTEIKIIGVRRLIAQRLSRSASEIPHFAYVEEVDVTELSALRTYLNDTYDRHLTLLPFLAQALIRVLPAWPQCNAHFDSEAGVLKQFAAVHLGIATQTEDGLKVPVLHDAQRMTLWQLGSAIRDAAAGARSGTAKPASLSGSTITISSLGRLGGIVSTPIINYPETAVIGINKAVERPVVRNGEIQIRTIMNISGSFDHRFVDGADAAGLVADLKNLLEHPAAIWLPPTG